MKNEAFLYIIKESEKLNQAICQVIKHFYKNKYNILVNTQDDNQIEDLDSLLWTFEQISFIPHLTDKDLGLPAPNDSPHLRMRRGCMKVRLLA